MTADIVILDGEGSEKYLRFPNGDGSSGSPAQGYGSDILTELQSILAKLIVAPATEANQTTANAALAAIQTALEGTLDISADSLPLPTGAATQATLAALLTELQAKADLTETQPVSASSLPLPSGAATEVTAAAIQAAAEAIQAAIEGTVAVSLASQPLPAGAATETTADAIKTAVEGVLSVDATGQGDIPVSLDGEAVTIADIQDGAGDSVMDAANDAIRVNVVAGAGSGGTASQDDSAFTAGTTNGTPMMAAATSDQVDAGDVGILAMDTDRNLKVSIENDAVGIGGGTQYDEGDTAATIRGNALLWEDAGDALTPVNASKPLPVAQASQPLPTGAATESTLDSVLTALGNLLTELQAKADLSETQPVSAAALPLPTGAATQATLAALLTELEGKADLAETQPVSAASLPLPSGAATETTLDAVKTAVEGTLDVDVTAVPALPSAPVYGQTTVTTAGTAVVLGSSAALDQGLTIKALAGNTGAIYVGDASVDSANGFELAAGEQVFIAVANRNAIYVDSAENGDGVSYIGS